MKNKTVLILFSFLAVYTIWGSTYLAIRVIVETAPPFISMSLRFTTAALLIFLFLLIKRKTKINKKEFLNSSFLGILFFAGGTGLIAWAEKSVPSGIACVLVSFTPLWFLIFDMILNKRKKPGILVWTGILIGFAGIILLVGFKDLNELANIPYLHFIIILVATIIWSFAAVLSPNLEKPKNGLLNLSVQMFAGGIALFIIGMFVGELYTFNPGVFNFKSVLALVYLILFGSIIALSAFTYLIENVRPGLVATYSYVNPIVALFLGWLILNEEINAQIILASCLILIGIAFIKFGDNSIKHIKLRRNKSSKKAA